MMKIGNEYGREMEHFLDVCQAFEQIEKVGNSNSRGLSCRRCKCGIEKAHFVPSIFQMQMEACRGCVYQRV